MKNPSLVAYKVVVQKFMEHFTFIKYKVVNRGENKLADLLATLATKSVLKKEKMTFRVEKQPGLAQDELCKEMLKTLQESIKKAKGREMKYTPTIRVFIQLWLYIHSTTRG